MERSALPLYHFYPILSYELLNYSIRYFFFSFPVNTARYWQYDNAIHNAWLTNLRNDFLDRKSKRPQQASCSNIVISWYSRCTVIVKNYFVCQRLHFFCMPNVIFLRWRTTEDVFSHEITAVFASLLPASQRKEPTLPSEFRLFHDPSAVRVLIYNLIPKVTMPACLRLYWSHMPYTVLSLVK
jgi:hypothetical protein